MKYPKLRVTETSRQMVDTFKGYNHNLRIGDGEFFDMRNMTSDYYPVLSPRGKRGVEVEVPECVAEVLMHQEEMLENIMLFDEAHKKGE